MSDPLIEHLDLAPGRTLKQIAWTRAGAGHAAEIWDYEVMAPDGRVEGHVRFRSSPYGDRSSRESFEYFDLAGCLLAARYLTAA
jgi:hypothetical protein